VRDFRLVVAVYDGDDVESRLLIALMHADVLIRAVANFSALIALDRFPRLAVILAEARFDFNENDLISFFGNDVNFESQRLPLFGYNAIAFAHQMFGCSFFAPIALGFVLLLDLHFFAQIELECATG